MPRDKKQKKPLVKKTLRIFCEGAKTEPYYIKNYLRHFREDNRASVKIMDCNKNTPVQLVDASIKFKNSNRSIVGDEFWVVYDRESVAKYSRKLHQKAWQKAQHNEINVALNNVCFEFWVLLHFVNSSASYGSFDDLKANSRLEIEVKKICGKRYDKASELLFEHIKDRISAAKSRAAKINSDGLKASGKFNLPFDINPYTDMPNLLSAIDRFK